MTASTIGTQNHLLLNFKHESLTTISRKSLEEMAKNLGFDESQTVHFALARLRDEVFGPIKSAQTDSFSPISPSQHPRIAAAQHAKRGKVIDTLKL